MKKNLFLLFALILSGLFISAIVAPKEATETIKWYTWEEAIAMYKKEPKKIFIDVYTDWCHWCKVMDKSTFPDAEVASYMNKYFYAVKLNAEQREDIQFDNHTFKYIAQGSRGVHELAHALLDGKLGYPSFVYLDEQLSRITISPGYKKPEDMIKELKFIGENIFLTSTWENYLQNKTKK